VEVPFIDHKKINVLVFQKNLVQNPVGHCPARTSWSIAQVSAQDTLIHIMLVVLQMCSLIILAVISDLQRMSLPRFCITINIFHTFCFTCLSVLIYFYVFISQTTQLIAMIILK